MKTVSHDDLVRAAERWLRVRFRCCPVLVEFHTASWEVPDAIGWRGGRSRLVECKASRDDFNTDKLKPFRARPETGMGMYRYYLTPPGLLRAEELPDGWGLAELRGRSIVNLVESKAFQFNAREEFRVLCSALRRIEIRMRPRVNWREFLVSETGKLPTYSVKRFS